MGERGFLLFAGTTEGRRIAGFLAELGLRVDIYTATSYGASVLEKTGICPNGQLAIHSGRLDREEILAEVVRLRPLAVVDATHPYAVEISANIRDVCDETGTERIRVARQEEDIPKDACIVRVADTEDAAKYLNEQEGRVLLTIGSKEIAVFCRGIDDKKRLCCRVLPSVSSIEACLDAGISSSQILAAEGPFSAEMNIACIRHFDARYLVSKETGREGGYDKKLEAVQKTGIKLVSIRRPLEYHAITEELAKERLKEIADLFRNEERFVSVNDT